MNAKGPVSGVFPKGLDSGTGIDASGYFVSEICVFWVAKSELKRRGKSGNNFLKN